MFDKTFAGNQYYYLRNARDNHAPLPLWGYSQLYNNSWKYQPQMNEILTQMAQVIISGAKGQMLFQPYVQRILADGWGHLCQVL